VLEFSSYLKQMVWFGLIAYLLFPGASAGLFALAIAGLMLLTALIEVSVAKMRLFRAVDYFGFALVLSLMAAAGALFGV